MPRNCSILGCGNNQTPELDARGVTYHKFPTDPEKRAEWIKLVNRGPDFNPKKSNYICSDHFEYEDFMNEPHRERIKLKKGVVPSIFPVLPDNVMFGPRKRMFLKDNPDVPLPHMNVTKTLNQILEGKYNGPEYNYKPYKPRRQHEVILQERPQVRKDDIDEIISDLEDLAPTDSEEVAPPPAAQAPNQRKQIPKRKRKKQKKKKAAASSDDLTSESEDDDFLGICNDSDQDYEPEKKKSKKKKKPSVSASTTNTSNSTLVLPASASSFLLVKKAPDVQQKETVVVTNNKVLGNTNKPIESHGIQLASPMVPITSSSTRKIISFSTGHDPQPVTRKTPDNEFYDEKLAHSYNELATLKKRRGARTCCILNCKNSVLKNKRDPTISFFQFPYEKYQPELRKVWIRNVRYQEWEPSDETTICSLHFEPECFKDTFEEKVALKENACPTIFNREGPSRKKIRAEQEKYYEEQDTKGRPESINSGVPFDKTTFNLKTEQLPTSLKRQCSVALKILKMQTSRFHLIYKGFLCGLEVPPTSLLPGVPKHILPQILPKVRYGKEKRKSSDKKKSKVVYSDHSYKYPTVEQLIMRNNTLISDMRKQQEQMKKSNKGQVDLRLNNVKLKRKVEILARLLKKERQANSQMAALQQLKPVSLDSIPPRANKMTQRPPWMPFPKDPTPPPTPVGPKMVTRKCQTRLKDFEAKLDEDLQGSDDEMVELGSKEAFVKKLETKKKSSQSGHWTQRESYIKVGKEERQRRQDLLKKKLELRRKEGHERYLKFQQNLVKKVKVGGAEKRIFFKYQDSGGTEQREEEIPIENGDQVESAEAANKNEAPHESGESPIVNKTEGQVESAEAPVVAQTEQVMEAQLVTAADGTVYAILGAKPEPDNNTDVHASEPSNVEETIVSFNEEQVHDGQPQDGQVDENTEEAFKIEEALRHIMSSPVKGESFN